MFSCIVSFVGDVFAVTTSPHIFSFLGRGCACCVSVTNVTAVCLTTVSAASAMAANSPTKETGDESTVPAVGYKYCCIAAWGVQC